MVIEPFAASAACDSVYLPGEGVVDGADGVAGELLRAAEFDGCGGG